jgi:transcriptional regulator with XRE-family HTH domain
MKTTNRIKELRSRRGLSQEELAERSGLSLRTIQRIENGETDPRGDSLRRLADSLGTSPDELADWAVAEDRTYLVWMLLSAMSFVLFPLQGILLPLVLWMAKKDKIRGLNRAAGEIISFEITWCMTVLIGSIAIIFFFLNRVESTGDVDMGMMTGYMKYGFCWFGITYLWNAAFIILNIVRLHRDRPLRFFPNLRFIRG